MAKYKTGGAGCVWFVVGAVGLGWLFGTESGAATLRVALFVVVGLIAVWVVYSVWQVQAGVAPKMRTPEPYPHTAATSRDGHSGVYQNWGRATSRPNRPPYQPGDGPGFEVHVKALLEELGYRVELTAGSSDRGVDHIAVIKRDLKVEKVVVQAKNLRGPAGFSAVQEIYTGKALHRADEAWVVSSNGFSRQATDGAKTLGVKLLSIEELTKRADSAWDASRFRGPGSEWRSSQPAGPANAASTRPSQRERKATHASKPPEGTAASSTRDQAKCWNCQREIESAAGSDGYSTCDHCGCRTRVR